MKLKGLKTISTVLWATVLWATVAMEQTEPAFAMLQGREDAGERDAGENHPKKHLAPAPSIEETAPPFKTAFQLARRDIWTEILKFLDSANRKRVKIVTKELYNAMWDGVTKVTFLQDTIPQGLTSSRVFDLLGKVKEAKRLSSISFQQPNSEKIPFLDVTRNILFFEKGDTLFHFQTRLSSLEKLYVEYAWNTDAHGQNVEIRPMEKLPTLPLKEICFRGSMTVKLSGILQTAPRDLEKLELFNFLRSHEDFQSLEQHLRTFNRLTELDISLNPELQNHFTSLFQSLPTNLKMIDLSDCALDNKAIRHLFQHRPPGLTDVRLEKNLFDSSAIEKLEGIEKLDIHDAKIHLEDMQRLLAESSTFKALCFGHPEIDKKTFQYFLQNKPATLEEMVFSFANFDLKLMELLIQKQNLTALGLSHCTFTTDSFEYLIQNFPQKITKLGLRGCKLGTRVQGLMLRLPKHLSFLNLSENNLDDETVEHVVRHAPEALEDLAFFGNSVGQKGRKALVTLQKRLEQKGNYCPELSGFLSHCCRPEDVHEN